MARDQKTKVILQGEDRVTPVFKSVDQQLNGLSKSIKNYGKGWTDLGAAIKGSLIIGGLSGITSALTNTVKVFAEKETALLRFDAVLSNIGADKQTNDRFKSLADDLEALGTGIDDANVLDLASQYLALGRSAPEVEKLLRVSADLSALTGDDLAASMAKLTKADEGQVKQLRMLIPDLKNLTDEQIRNGEAVDIVASKTKGLAEQIGGGTAGSINKLSASWDNLLESIGRNIEAAPWLKSLTNLLNDLANATNNASNILGTKELSSKLKDGSLEKYEADLKHILALKKYAEENLKTGKYNNTFADYRDFANTAQLKTNIFGFFSESDLAEAITNLDRMQTQISYKINSLKPIPVKVEPVVTAKTPAKALTGTTEKPIDPWAGARVSFQDYKIMVSKGYEDYIQYNDELDRQIDEYFQSIEDAKKAKLEADNKAFSNIVSFANQSFSAIQGFYGAWMELENQRNQAALANYDRELKSLEERYNAEKKAKDDLGLSSAEIDIRYEKQKADLEAKRLAKENEFGKKAFESNKINQIASAAMGTANAVIGALGSFPFSPANLALASIVGGLGAAQIGLISAQQYTPKFADGGIVPGTSYTGDRVLSLTNSGEMILNAGQQARLFRIIDGQAGAGRGTIINLTVNGIVGSPDLVAKEIYSSIERLKNLNQI